MKRWVVLLVLMASAAGVGMLLLEGGADPVVRRDAAGNPLTNGPDREFVATADPNTMAGDGRPAVGKDDDPNRIDGAFLTIRGIVLRGDEPLGGAEVTIHRARAWNAERTSRRHVFAPIATGTTHADGRFEFTIPRRRTLIVHASADGLAFARHQVIVPTEGNPAEITLILRAGTTLHGSVVNEKDEPVVGADVEVRYRNDVMDTATTDEAGRFAIPHLPDLRFQVQVGAKGYPRVSRLAGMPRNNHLRFELAPGGRIVGRVVNAAASAVANATVVLSLADSEGLRARVETTTDANGEYVAEPALAGYMTMATVEHQEYGWLATPASIRMKPVTLTPGGETRFDITLPAGIPLRGTVVVAKTKAPVGGARIGLFVMRAGQRGLSEAAVTTSAPDGTFFFPHVAEGSYAVEALADGAARHIVRWGQQSKPLTLDFFGDGETPIQAITLELAPTGDIEGHVKGIAPELMDRMSINLQNTPTPPRVEKDSTGYFRFRNIAPAEGLKIASWNPQLTSEPFDVTAGETTQVDLDGTAADGFGGVVVDEEGAPIKGAKVQAIPSNRMRSDLRNFLQGNGWSAATTDAEGRFTYRAPSWMRQSYKAHEYVLIANHDGYLATYVEGLKLPAEGQSTTTRVTLTKGGTVRGRVEFASGAPAVGRTVSLNPSQQPSQQPIQQPIQQKDRTKRAPYEKRARRTAYTDFDGKFELVGVGAGEYSISTAHPDYKAQAPTVRAGDSGITLVLEATESIRGMIVTAEGEPVTNGRVYVIIPRTGTKEQKRYGSLQGGGRFVISHLEPGAYAIEVEPQRNNYNNAASFKRTRIPPVATGTTDVVIEVLAGAAIRGRIVGPDGKGMPAVGIIAMPVKLKSVRNSWNRTRPTAFSDGRGHFRIVGLGEEEVELLFLSTSHRPLTRRAMPGTEGLAVRLETGAVIEGRVLLPDGKPLVNFYFNFQAANPEIMKRLQDYQQRSGQSYWSMNGWNLVNARTDAKGKFSITTLLPGRYKLTLRHQDGVLPPTTLTTGNGPQTLQLQAALKIKGRVTDSTGNPIVPTGNQQVGINAQGPSGQWLGNSTPDRDGNFEITGLPPGPVKLRVYARGYLQKAVQANAGDHSLNVMLERNNPRPKR